MGQSFWERHKERVWFLECELKFAEGLLEAHHQDYHGKERLLQWDTPLATPEHRLYRVSLSIADGSIRCPVG